MKFQVVMGLVVVLSVHLSEDAELVDGTGDEQADFCHADEARLSLCPGATFSLPHEAVSKAGTNSCYFETRSVSRRRSTLPVESLGSALTM
jgi:hypothetical protein